MSEQSPQANSQPVETPQSHEREMEDRIMGLLDPEADTETAPEPEVKAPEVEATEDSPEQPEVVEAKEPEIPEAEEIEYEGSKYKVAPQLKEAFLRQQDYTKKTQEASELRKNAESMLQQASQVLELQKSMAPKMGQLASLDEQISQYEKVDWNTLTAQDATRAQQLFIAFQTAKDARGKLVGELNQLHTQQIESAKKAHAAKLEEGRKVLARDIKGWNEELGKKILTSTAEAYGAPSEILESISEPWAVRALNDAMQWRNLQASKPAIEKKAPAQTKTIKPQASESRAPAQLSYDQDRRALKGAKNSTDMSKAAERLILRKLG